VSALTRALPVALLWCASASGATTDAELARCAVIGTPEARLECFDALAARHRPAPPAAAPGSLIPPAAAASAPRADASASPRSPPASGDAPGQSAAPASDAAHFGFSPAQLHSAPAGPESIEAAVVRVGQSSLGQTTVALDNGQTWLIREGDVRLSAGDKVTIKRAALGSFLLLAPSRHSYRANRLH
jgi:hypothetical protein